MALVTLAAAALLAAIVAMLAVPVSLQFQLRGPAPLRGQLTLRVLFGLWCPRLALPLRRERVRHRTEPSPRPSETASRDDVVAVRWLWRSPSLRRFVESSLSRALSHVRWSELRLHACVGLEDPADTGCLWAWLGPLSTILSGTRHVDIALLPDFTGPRLEFEVQGRAALVPWLLLWPLALLASRLAFGVVWHRLADTHAR